jgi:hypothetical protein
VTRYDVVVLGAGMSAGVAAGTGHPLVAVAAMVPLFLTIVVAAHDVVHTTLGLSRRAEDVLLCVVGLPVALA